MVTYGARKIRGRALRAGLDGGNAVHQLIECTVDGIERVLRAPYIVFDCSGLGCCGRGLTVVVLLQITVQLCQRAFDRLKLGEAGPRSIDPIDELRDLSFK